LKTDNLSAALSELDNDFQTIEGYDVVPDGVYWSVMEDVTLEVAQPSGNPRIIWKLRIIGPDHYGRQLQRVLVVTRDSLRWLKRDMYVCGVALKSLRDLAGCLEDLLNLKLRARKQAKSVHILEANAPASAQGRLSLHLIDQEGREYPDQQLRPWQHPKDRQEFEALIDYFVNRYQSPMPGRALLEDAHSGRVLFSTDQSYPQK
jgi:hypothetical protein